MGNLWFLFCEPSWKTLSFRWSYCLFLLKAPRTLQKAYSHVAYPFTKVWKGPQRSFGHCPASNQAHNQETITPFFVFRYLSECCRAAPQFSLAGEAIVHFILSNTSLIIPDPPLFVFHLSVHIYFKSVSSSPQSNAHQNPHRCSLA